MCIGVADGYKPTGHQKKKKYSMEEFFDITATFNTFGYHWAYKKFSLIVTTRLLSTFGKQGKPNQQIRIMAIVHMLFYYAARYNINLIIIHIADVNYAIADVPSHFQVTCFQ